jgi:lysine 2,3-aminomutase
VHQVAHYNQNLGISYWTKNYRTGLESTDPDALNRVYPFFDPIDTLAESGQSWWRQNSHLPSDSALDEAIAAPPVGQCNPLMP